MEPDHEHVLVSADGSMRDHFNMVYSADDAERIRTGYCCINCGESQVDHGAPFPASCWVCGYEMRDKQTERYGMEFRGNVRLGPSTTIDEELAIAEEMVERQKLAKLGMKKTSSIIVPGWANA
jgi:hypothetical protein